ncbi:DNA-directed RNA polymerase subunit beta' [Ralstonia phage RP13]|nr:DNA-directed RNA polymerase subunit beta' [Ralstonia phage RP13]
MKYTLKLMTDARMEVVSGGEVRNYGTYNFKFSNPKPVENGLFCQKIFGPLKDFTCACGTRKKKSFDNEFKGTACGVCGVEYLPVAARGARFGFIDTKCYYVNPLMYSTIGGILGIGSNALKELSLGQRKFRIDAAPFGLLADGHGNNYRIVMEGTPDWYGPVPMIENPNDPDGDPVPDPAFLTAEPIAYQSINSLVMEMKKLGIDGNVVMMNSHLKQARIYHDNGFSLWDMFNTRVLVAPPIERDMRFISEDRVGYGEVNTLYTRLVREGIRVSAILDEPEDIISKEDAEEMISFESLIVQKLVNMLYVDGAESGSINVPPILETLKGKGGIIRGNLLGKRVDFSGRSCIASGPHLPINTVGLPGKMVYELCKPIIIRDLATIIQDHDKFTRSEALKLAIKEYDRMSPRAYDLMEKISKSIRVLMNRAPSLHRYSAMTFQVVIHGGKYIQFPPMACSPFNADFDGDTMAVHLILTDEAMEETVLTDYTYNLMHSGAFNKPNAAPSHEMTVGAYLLSM